MWDVWHHLPLFDVLGAFISRYCLIHGSSYPFDGHGPCLLTGKVTFRTVAPAGMIHMLKGEYTLTEKGPNLTGVHFVVIADLRGATECALGLPTYDWSYVPDNRFRHMAEPL